MSDDYEDRLARAMAQLEASGINALNHSPPVFRLARALGLRPRPPHFMSVARAILLTGPAFGLLWGLAMWVFVWREAGMSVLAAILVSILSGALFGLAMAGYYRWSGANAGLSRWEDL